MNPFTCLSTYVGQGLLREAKLLPDWTKSLHCIPIQGRHRPAWISLGSAHLVPSISINSCMDYSIYELHSPSHYQIQVWPTCYTAANTSFGVCSETPPYMLKHSHIHKCCFLPLTLTDCLSGSAPSSSAHQHTRGSFANQCPQKSCLRNEAAACQLQVQFISQRVRQAFNLPSPNIPEVYEGCKFSLF